MLERVITFDIININMADVNNKDKPKIIQNSVLRIFFRLPPVNRPNNKQNTMKENNNIIPIV